MMNEMTVKRKLKRPEVLAPAGTLEKLKTAIHYGADAVYIGGNAYGLRSRAGNFTYEEMAEGVAFAKNTMQKCTWLLIWSPMKEMKKALGNFSAVCAMSVFLQ